MRSSIVVLLAAALVIPCVAIAQDAKAGKKLALSLEHVSRERAKCASFESGKLCADLGHWVFEVKGVAHADDASLRALLQKEAEAERKSRAVTSDPRRRTPLSELEVTIHASRRAPYGRVQAAMNACGEAAIYKVDLSGSSAEDARPEVLKVWLPTDAPKMAFMEEDPPEVRVILDYDAKTEKTVRRAGERATSDDKDLVAAIVKARSKCKKPDETSIIIDAPWNAPFGEVLRVVELCAENALSPIEFAQPAPAAAPK